MDPGFSLGGDSYNWFESFRFSTASQLMQPQTMLWIVALLLTVGLLAFVVASMSQELDDVAPDTGTGRRLEEAWGAACAWRCPWQAPAGARRTRAAA